MKKLFLLAVASVLMSSAAMASMPYPIPGPGVPKLPPVAIEAAR